MKFKLQPLTLHVGNEVINLNSYITKGKDRRTVFRFAGGNLVIETGSGDLGEWDLKFVEEKKNWIVKHYRNLAARQEKTRQFIQKIKSEQSVLYLGEWKKLEILAGKKNEIQLTENGITLFRKKPSETGPVIEAGEVLQTLAKNYLPELTARIAAQMKLSYQKITVKDVSSKWGSCSSRKNLNFNWHVIHFREEVVKYLIVHELSHLVHLNHSDAFWELVSKFCPQHENLSAELRAGEWLIGIYQTEF